jgi:hypothetical protein
MVLLLGAKHDTRDGGGVCKIKCIAAQLRVGAVTDGGTPPAILFIKPSILLGCVTWHLHQDTLAITLEIRSRFETCLKKHL